MHARTLVRRVGGCLLVAAALTTTITACGDDSSDSSMPKSVPSGDVAVVGDQSISQARFDRALAARTRGIAPLAPAQSTPPLDAPRFARCAAAQRKALQAATKGSKGAVLPSTAQLKANCASQYQQIRQATMSALIQESWITQEAAAKGVKVDAKAIDTTLQQYVAAAATTPGGKPLSAAAAQRRFDRRLKASGLTQEDVRGQIASQLAQAQVQQRTQTTVDTPTAAEAKKYLAANPQKFGKAGTAKVDVVVAKTEAAAMKAAKALKKGTEVQAVIATVADKAIVNVRQGRIPLTQGDGQLSQPLEAKVFTASKGAVVGPVQVGSLFYVARVESVRKGKAPSYAKIATQVQQQLMAERAQAVRANAQANLIKTWRPRTRCAKGHIVPECGNSPAAPVVPGVTTTG